MMIQLRFFTMITQNVLTIVVYLSLVPANDAVLAPEQIFSFFEAKNINTLDAILCSTEDTIAVMTYFAKDLLASEYARYFRVISKLADKNVEEVERLGIFADLSCQKNRQLISEINESWFTSQITWLFWDSENFLADSKLSIPMSTFSNVHLTRLGGIFRIVKFSRALPGRIYEEGRWNNKTGRTELTRLNIVIDMQQTKIKAAIMFIQDIYNRSKMSEQLQDESFMPGMDGSNRFTYAYTLNLAKLFNLRVDLVVTENWGDRNENGSWNGMMGLLQHDQADVAISAMLGVPQRAEIAFPTIPIVPFWMAVIFQQPRALGTYRALILELAPSVWCVLGLLVILGAIAFFFTQKYSRESTSDPSLTMGLLQAVGIVANQGLCYQPHCSSSRIVCFSLLVVGLLISTYYSAGTMTALLSESPPLIKSLEQLIESNIPLTALDAPYINNVKARNRVFKELVANKIGENVKVCSMEDGVSSIMNGSAFIGEYFELFDGISKTLKSHTICDLTVFNGGFDSRLMNYVRKCSHFREMHTRGLLRSFEHGLMMKEQQRWFASKPLCSRITQFIYVRLESVSIALGIYLIGFLLSAVILCLEIYLNKKIRKIPKRKIRKLKW